MPILCLGWSFRSSFSSGEMVGVSIRFLDLWKSQSIFEVCISHVKSAESQTGGIRVPVSGVRELFVAEFRSSD